MFKCFSELYFQLYITYSRKSKVYPYGITQLTKANETRFTVVYFNFPALAMRNLHKKYNIFATHMPWNNPHMIFSVFLSSIGKRAHFEVGLQRFWNIDK